MRHVPMTRGDLIDVLSDMLAAVQANDSFEGSIEYLMPGPLAEELREMGERERAAKLEEGEFAVVASYRVGNSMGQGGVRMVGEMETR